MKFELTVLGSNSALPAHGRYPSAQVLQVQETPYLIDCGEGTQVRLRTYKMRFMRIDRIFITHLHGDHVFGLPGFINTLSHHNRTKDLHVYGPVGIEEFLETVLRLSQSRMEFRICYHELDHQGKQVIHQDKNVKVSAFPLKHRIATYGYFFEELQEERNIRTSAIEKYHLDFEQIRSVKAGEDLQLTGGNRIPAEELLEPLRPLRSFAYCSDTRFDLDLIPFVRNVSLLYHEATFLHEAVSKAEYSQHSTAMEAGKFALEANAGSLLIGHFSSRYEDLDPLLAEAREVFPYTYLAIEGTTYSVDAPRGQEGLTTLDIKK